MPIYFQRPENALKRADEFIDVGKKQRALDALYDVIKSKKHRTWQKIHEPIMEKYLNLCVDLKKSHVAKEGLYQYKNICQQVNIKSLEDVVRKYLALAEQKTEEAQAESKQSVVDIDDLDVLQTPESLLLSAVSGEDTQDRTDRAILTPWVKFLWESYRQCLDLLRNNSSVEKLYQDIAQQAFKFCLKYARKTEFRKLCDNLRTHLGHIHKHQHQQRAINLNNPESQAMHLETRLVQLDSAINMELWQEAYKAIEDVHGLITLSKKSPRPSLMANYYQKLALVFWKSGNYLFHACALQRLFHLSREQKKNLSVEDTQKMASRVLCSTLAIPIPPARNQVDRMLEMDDNTLEKQRRLATLLGLNNPPTRSQMIKDLKKYNIVQHVHVEMQNLFRWLEVEFHPLKLSMRVSSSLEFIEQNEDLAQYVGALQDITVTRLIKQVSQVYEKIEFARLAALAPFTSQFRLERVIVDAARNLDLQVRIDHRTRSLSFGTDLGVAQKEDVAEGPCLQSMPSEQIRNQLIHFSQALHQAVDLIQPKQIKTDEELRMHILQSYRQSAKKDHLRILQRRQIIEERKEELENINTKREREEMQQQEEAKRKQYEAEMARLEREAAERERARQAEERREIARKHAKERIEQLKNTTIGAKLIQNMAEEELAELDADDIMAKQVEQLEKEKKELQDRLKSQSKKIDFFQRAMRVEEIPLLEEQYKAEAVKAKEWWEEEEAVRITNQEEERKVALTNRDRLKRMLTDKEEFVDKLKDARKSVYKEKQLEYEKRLNEERKKRMVERREKRKEERRLKRQKEREEREQRERDEALLREREEKEREEAERREAEEAEYNERLAKLEEQAARQRAREAEVEAKLADDRARPRVDRDDRGGGGWRRGGDDGGDRGGRGGDEGGWRRGGDDGGDRGGRGGDEGGWRRGGDRGGDRDAEERGGRGADEGGWRRGGDRGGEEGGSAWKPSVKAGGWRDRVKEREDSWKPRSRLDDEGGEERDGSREPEERPAPREREAEPAKEAPQEGGGGGSWRDRVRDREEDRRPPPSRDFGDRGPRDRDFGDRGPRDRDFGDRGPRDRDFGDRGPRDRDFGDRGPRDRDFDRGPRDFDRGPRDRDFGDRGGPRDRDFSDRGPPREDRSDGGGWRDRGPPRESAWGRDDRGPRDNDRGGGGGAWRGGDRKPMGDDGDSWRRGGGGGGMRGRDDRDGGGGGGGWRDRGEDRRPAPRDEERGGGGWRDRGPPREDRGPSRDDRPPPRDEGGAWRRGGDAKPAGRDEGRGAWRGKENDERAPPAPRERESAPAPSGGEPQDDGWTTVRR